MTPCRFVTLFEPHWKIRQPAPPKFW